MSNNNNNTNALSAVTSLIGWLVAAVLAAGIVVPLILVAIGG